MLARWATPLFIVVLAGCLISGCGEDQSAWNSDIHDLSTVPLSPELQLPFSAGVAALKLTDPDTESVRDYMWYRSIRARIHPLDTRQAAADEIYSRWRDDPTNLMCLRLARSNLTLFDRDDEFEAALFHPALMDTNTALGAYAESARTTVRGGRAYWYRKSESLKGDLSPIDRAILSTAYASLDKTEGRFRNAINRLITELPAARQAGGHMMESVYWESISNRLATADRLDDALHAATLSTAHALITKDLYRILMTKINLATIVAQRGEYALAIDQLERLAQTGERQNLPWIVLVAFDNAAQFASEAGDYQTALTFDRNILRHARQMNDRVNIPRSLASIAHDHNMTGHLDSTRIYLQQAQEFVAATDVKANRAKMAELMAGYYCQVGNYAAAESMLVAALDIHDAGSSYFHQTDLLLQLIPEALEIGRPDLAYQWLARVDLIKSSLDPRSQYVNYLADYELFSAQLLADQGEYGLAHETLTRARVAVERSGGEGKLWQLEAQAGEIALRRGDIKEAERAYTHCLDLALQGQDPRRLARSRFQLGELYLDQGQLASAQALFSILNNETTFGNAYRTGLTSLLLRGLTYLDGKQYEVAWHLFQDGLDRLNADSPADLKQRFHLFKGQALMGLEQYAAATVEFDLVEQSFSNARLQNRFAELPVFATDIKRDLRESRVANLIASHPNRLPTVAGQTLDIAYPDLLKRLGKYSSQGPALVYLLGETESWSWVVYKGQVSLRVLPGRSELQEIIDPVLIDLNRPERPVDTQLLSLLATTLLDDLAYHWPISTELTLVLDGFLKSVPWAALPLPGSQNIVLERGPMREIAPLVQQHVPNRHADHHQPDPTHMSLLAIGCNSPSGNDLKPLREAEREVQNIYADWDPDRRRLLVGQNASWTDALANGLTEVDVIHIASHADVRHGSARRSTLRLTSKNEDGTHLAGPVTMTAVARLELQAEVVYLSSCRTGAPTTTRAGQPGDFINSFLSSGAKTVIASTQWMDDEAARTLAENFYKNWRQSKNKAEALQVSRLALRKNRSHPSYWAFMRLVTAD